MTGSRVAIYARVSTDRQAQEGTIESQIQAVKAYATEHGYTIDDDLVFADNGIGGSTLARPKLVLLRDKADKGDVAKVLVLCPDRLARKHVHQLLLVEEFSRLGVEMEFTNRTVGESPEDQLLLQIQGVISEFEREKFLERSRRGRIHRAKNQCVSVLSHAPCGYNYIKKTKTEDARYEINFEEAKIVRWTFAKCVNEHLTLGEIKRLLIEANVPTKKRRTWANDVIRVILSNPAYTGKVAYKKTIAVARERVTRWGRTGQGYPRRAKSINTTNPANKLDVSGSVSIGYTSPNAAPASGLIVSGNVGIGTTSPGQKLQVSGGSIASAAQVVTFSAAPAFDASTSNIQKLTLTGNVTSSTLTNATAGQYLYFVLCQDATGSRTFTWPANAKSGMTIGATANTCSAQSFIFDGTNAYALIALSTRPVKTTEFAACTGRA